MTALYIIGGIACLYFGGDALVTAGAQIGRRFGISRLIIGLTIVAFGTSCPELATTLEAASAGRTDMAFGNVVGSNIANIGLVLGVGAVLTRIQITRRFLIRDVPVLIISAVGMWIFALDGRIETLEGAALLVFLIGYLWVLMRQTSQGDNSILEEIPDEAEMPLGRAILMLVLGVAMLVGGAELLVHGGVAAARVLGVSERVIGLSLVALGTSLPELASTIIACSKGQDDMAIGNVVGSNIFNVLAILGTTATVHPVHLDIGPLPIDMGVLMALTVLVPLLTMRGPAGRPAGFLLLTIYFGYMASLSMRGV